MTTSVSGGWLGGGILGARPCGRAFHLYATKSGSVKEKATGESRQEEVASATLWLSGLRLFLGSELSRHPHKVLCPTPVSSLDSPHPHAIVDAGLRREAATKVDAAAL